MIQQADEDITEGCIGTRWGPISKTVPRPDENAKISQFSGALPLGTGPLFFGQIEGGGRPNEVFFKTYQFTGASPPRLPIQNMQSWPTGGPKAAPRHLAFDMCKSNEIHGYGTSTQVLLNYHKPKEKNSSQGFVH